MIIRGILDDSLEQLCIRGFAPIVELAKISKPNYEYQRTLIDTKTDALKEYLNNSEYAFFSEVILSYKLEQDITIKSAKEPIVSIREDLKFSSNVNYVKVVIKEQKWKESNEVNTKNVVRIAELSIPDNYLDSLITQGKHPFHRIDGNHRLTIAENNTSDKFNRINIPFCIILMQSVKKEKFDDTTKKLEPITETSGGKFEKIVFYNINGKSTPLTYEENLSAILSDEFSDSEITKTIGASAIIVKKLKENITSVLGGYSGIKNIVSGCLLTISIKLIELLLKNDIFIKKSEEEKIALIKRAFEDVNTIYNGNTSINTNSNIELFISFLYYASLEENSARIKQFENWVCKNDLFNVADTKAGDFIKIFDKIFEHNIKIFIAMPYFDGNPATVAEYNRVYTEAISEIQNTFSHQNLSLFDIMQYTGSTTNILDSIFSQIKECSIFIVDITAANANVFCEYGYAKALNKDIVIFKKADDSTKIPFDIDKYNRYEYSSTYQLRDLIVLHVSNILVKQYGLIKVNK